MSEEPIPGYRLKLRWAKHHVKLLHDTIDRHLDTYTVRSQLYMRDSVVVVHLVIPEPRKPWELILGDAIYNLRSSLDQLAFALVPPDGMMRDIEKTSAFPISRDPDHWRAIRHRIKAVPDEARTIIECLQPHVRRDDIAEDPLWILEELSNIDKHRTLHAVVLGVEGTTLRANHLRDLVMPDVVEFNIPRRLEHGTELARFPVSDIGPDPHVNVDLDAMFAVTFDERGAVAPDEHVIGVLTAIAEDIEGEIFPRLERFIGA